MRHCLKWMATARSYFSALMHRSTVVKKLLGVIFSRCVFWYSASATMWGSGRCDSRGTLPECLWAMGNRTPAVLRRTSWGQWQWNSCSIVLPSLVIVGSGTFAVHCRLAAQPGAVGSGTPDVHCRTTLGAVGSENPSLHCRTTRGQGVGELLRYTPTLPWGGGGVPQAFHVRWRTV